tara:strand:+ start:3777 stop:4442 length:666 start_codon:yes stop_codon:yes gene_type:complete
LKVKIDKTWENELNEIFNSNFFQDLTNNVKKEYKNYEVFPPGKDILNSFNLCSFDKMNVVILGQDPYHGVNQANGLCFSVNKGIKIPPSLKNIYKELKNNYNNFEYIDGDLSHWAKQGVLLLNSILTVRKGLPGSHKEIGWEKFTDMVINLISKRRNNIVFLLWGSFAKSKIRLIENIDKHLILSSAHPSPFSAYNGFFDNNHFKKANDYLKKNKKDIINW